jgi:hypothetical protein
MRLTKIRLVTIGFVILSLEFGCLVAASSEANTPQDSGKYPRQTASQRTGRVSLTEVFLPHLNILFGYALGFFSMILVDYWRKRQRVKEFRQGMQIELQHALVSVNLYTLNYDSDVTKDRFNSWRALSIEFDLPQTVSPLEDSSLDDITKKRIFSEQELDNYVVFHAKRKADRQERGVFQDMKKIHCNFIQNSISSVSLLAAKERTLLLNILRRLDLINYIISRLDFSFEKSYDANISEDNRHSLRENYRRNCQLIADRSYETAKEIAHLLRQ